MKTHKLLFMENFWSRVSSSKRVLTACCLVMISLASLALAQRGVPKKLVVHEWGTFTSLQGGDGEPILWRSRNIVPLPSFVYNWMRPGFNRRCTSPYSFTGKGEMMAMQRMETPVIYFYSDTEQTVDLSVRFPNGLVTEWYPQAQEIGPAVTFANNKATANSSDRIADNSAVKESVIHWKNFRVTPENKSSSATLPADKRGGHYFSARETDSARVHLDWQSGTNAATEHEKFLFYRGVGNFSTPLKVKMSLSGDVTLANTSKEMLTELFVLGVNCQAGKFIHVDRLAPGEEKSVAFDLKSKIEPLKKLSPRLAAEMAAALTKQKLYPREATAMVNTWRDLWFEEPGVRVLYVLPRAWTEATLPLEMKPAPTEMIRLMVGRAEVITPGIEQKLVDQLVRANQNADVQSEIQATLKELGRFAEPVLQRALISAKIKPEKQGRWFSLLAATQPKSPAILPEKKS